MNELIKRCWLVIVCLFVINTQYIFAQEKSSSLKNELGVVIKETVNPGQIDKVEEKVQQWQRMADKYKKQKKYSQAIKCLKNAIRDANPLWGEHNIIEASMKMQIATLYMKKNEYDQAIVTLKDVRKSYCSSMAHTLKPLLYYKLQFTLTDILFSLDKYAEAQKEIDSVKQSLPELKTLNNKEYLIKYYYWQARLQIAQKNSADAIKFAGKCISLIGSDYNETNKVSLIQSYNFICSALTHQKRMKEQLPYREKCLEICKRNYADDKIIIGYQYYNHGMYYYDIEDYEKAIAYFDKAINSFSLAKENEPGNLGLALLLKGKCLAELKKWESALDVFQKSTDQFLEINETHRTSFTYDCLYDAWQWLFLCAYKTKKYSLGSSCYNSIESVRNKGSKTMNLVKVYFKMANIMLLDGNPERAEKCCRASLKIAETLPESNHRKKNMALASWVLAQSLYNQKKIKEAVAQGYSAYNLDEKAFNKNILSNIKSWESEIKKDLFPSHP